MKTIFAPFIPGLDRMSFQDLLLAMETGASRDYVGCVNWPDAYPYKPVVAFDVARSERHLFVSYHVEGLDLKAVFANSNDPVWQDSCVEFFVGDPASPLYYNFEFNCIGTCLASKRTCAEDRVFLQPEEIGRIIRHTSVQRTAFEERSGIFFWHLVAGIPFEVFGFTPETLPAKLRVNFFKCGDKTSHPHYLSWSPIVFPKPNFHLPEFFGELNLE